MLAHHRELLMHCRGFMNEALKKQGPQIKPKSLTSMFGSQQQKYNWRLDGYVSTLLNTAD